MSDATRRQLDFTVTSTLDHQQYVIVAENIKKIWPPQKQKLGSTLISLTVDIAFWYDAKIKQVVVS